MRRYRLFAIVVALAALFSVQRSIGAADHPAPLAIGAPAPDFSLPGIDGKTYSLSTFKDSKALVVIFTAVHCPTAEVYEARIKALIADYTPKGVAFAVIQPNSAKALRLDEMGYTDVGDSLADMVRTSGTTFQCSIANHFPVRPKPDITSSAIITMPYLSQSARTPCM